MQHMRIAVLLLGAGISGTLGAFAPATDVPFEPYNKHHDTRFGHDHFYPDRGAIVKSLPRSAALVTYAGLAYRFQDGVWYEPRGPAFMVVAPPIGVIVPSLPGFATLLAKNGQTLIYCNDVYYRPRPDANGYEVVNDPAEPTFQVGSEAASAAVPGASPSSAAPTSATGTSAALDTGASDQAGTAPPSPSAPKAAERPLPRETGSAAATPPAASDAPAAAVAVSASAPASPPTNDALTPGGATAAPPKGIKVALTATKGQDSDQQARDRYECYRFAVAQSGFDPMRASGGTAEYDRSQAACLQARGYTVR